MSPSSSIWHKLLTSSSTSEAIERASLHSLMDLQMSALPVSFCEMSPNAQENLMAICRAFEVSIGGIQSDGWDSWKAGANDLDDWEKAVLEIKRKRARIEDPGADQTSAVVLGSEVGAERLPLKSEKTPVQNKPVYGLKEGKRIDAPNATSASEPESAQRAGKGELDAAEKNSVEQIRNWALLSSHTDPPQEAIEIVLRSGATSRILRHIVPDDSTPLIRAAVISSFTEMAGAAVASIMMAEIIVPYVKTLKAPAPREMMTAVVKFCTYHWRAAVAMYTHFGDIDKRINGAIAEVLARVAAGLSPEAALLALREYSKCTWGEDGIKVIEALMARGKDQAGIVNAIVPSLEKNVIGMEKSVRFGKLLFTTVKDFPVVENEYEQVLESVAARSKVFLAKRALSHIRNKK